MRSKNNNNPFVGPVPCSESDAMNFYGRDVELRDLLQKVKIQALTIITAESGAGKTSLINAGLIPALRYLREGDTESTGFALYVGSWGSIAQKSESAGGGIAIGATADIFRQAVNAALKDIDKRAEDYSVPVGIKQLKTDLKALSAVPSQYENQPDRQSPEVYLAAYIAEIKKALPGHKLILIVDQAEEFMGSGVGAGRDFLTMALTTLASLIQTEGVKVIISLREEYMGRLRLLEGMYLPLAPRTFHLYPLAWDNARKTLVQVAVSSDRVDIGEAEMDTVLEWANSSSYNQAVDRNTATVDMLSAQAFLSDIYDTVYDSMKSKGVDADALPIRADKQCLEGYKNALHEAEPRLKEQEKDFYIGALLRWIDRAFEELGDDGPLIRRIAANMGSVLATPRGFKSHITRGSLIFHAIREEMPMCFKDDREKKQLADKINTARKLLKAGKGLSAEAGYNERAVKIWRAAGDAVDRLVEENILKVCGQDDSDVILSLQHDGYASALTEWCTDPKRREDDALVPDIGVYGKQIVRTKPIEQPELKELRWDGCFVDQVEVSNVDFIDCSFDASFMTNCVFTDCNFVKCKINGAFILNGSLTKVKFEHCTMLGTVIKNMVWDTVAFVDCNISSAVISDIRLENALRFEKSKALYAQLYTFKPVDESRPPRITAQEFNIFGALFQDFDEKNKECFDCQHWTEYTSKAPPLEEKSADEAAS